MFGEKAVILGINNEIRVGVDFLEGHDRRLHNQQFNCFIGANFWNLESEMEEEAEIICPFCGQGFALLIDTSVSRQQFTTDCEVCCRPFLVFAECEPGEILSLDAQSE